MTQPQTKWSAKNRRGFTLVELLVVIAIIGILAATVFIALNYAREGAKVSRAREDMKQLNLAMERLFDDTGEYSNHELPDPCIDSSGAGVSLDACEAGLACDDGNFQNWQGPYVGTLEADPWGSQYYFDPNYTCFQNVDGCGDVPDNTPVRAIVSFGPNLVGPGLYDEPDNHVVVLCR
ncbi:MAG: hypothetical protein A2722_01440 [Candidatus Doudnabacteria bacterium RIFCSPHIGHO2_01_FULL_50_11]|uniref:Type II secretion system protein GspG C-terminal domain-containing protein n=1 Tax=Candidatus Doudnabacteria bacterium RIFCSPHIGHO2_01_FULL_50_11 TaxID=1817828 RepID=A0A1F5PH20_9BACT|nr:MAG: hypothetical protein A2722_01440 [Candidatus Doudnabacteria bacterium RIFCSPHIGHO2_01_FULL_50_11]HLC44531.1 type II secretion system protein [Patescibacteria group bacterium]